MRCPFGGCAGWCTSLQSARRSCSTSDLSDHGSLRLRWRPSSIAAEVSLSCKTVLLLRGSVPGRSPDGISVEWGARTMPEIASVWRLPPSATECRYFQAIQSVSMVVRWAPCSDVKQCQHDWRQLWCSAASCWSTDERLVSLAGHRGQRVANTWTKNLLR
jgi:hypothetical protein